MNTAIRTISVEGIELNNESIDFIRDLQIEGEIDEEKDKIDQFAKILLESRHDCLPDKYILDILDYFSYIKCLFERFEKIKND
jgi:hypothetical protein